MTKHLTLTLLGAAAFATVTTAYASTVTVDGTAVVYCTTSASCASNAGGTVPVAISVAGIQSLTFSVGGSVSLNSMQSINDADGVGAAPGNSSNSGHGIYAGINAPYAGYLTGLFTGNSNAAGTATDYLGAGAESQTSYSPTQNQAFFIGDGLTGDGTGSTQTFYVPAGATELYLGISDACFYNGAPSCYSDNSGDFTVTYTPTSANAGSTTPEPSSLVLLGTGMMGLAGAARRRLRKA